MVVHLLTGWNLKDSAWRRSKMAFLEEHSGAGPSQSQRVAALCLACCTARNSVNLGELPRKRGQCQAVGEPLGGTARPAAGSSVVSLADRPFSKLMRSFIHQFICSKTSCGAPPRCQMWCWSLGFRLWMQENGCLFFRSFLHKPLVAAFCACHWSDFVPDYSTLRWQFFVLEKGQGTKRKHSNS